MSGTDANCGDTTGTNAKAAFDAGPMSENDVDVALVRLFAARMRTGEFGSKPVKYAGEEFQAGKQIQAADHQILENEPAQGMTTPTLPLDGAQI